MRILSLLLNDTPLWVGMAVLGMASASLFAANPDTGRKNGPRQPGVVLLETAPSPAQVHAGGIVAARLRFSLDKLVRDRKVAHALYSGWGADQIGRWIAATVLEATLLRDTSSTTAIAEKVAELIAAQDAEGFYYGKQFRATPERKRECWFGQGRGIWSLLQYYEVMDDQAALESAKKAADLVVAKHGEWTISKPLCGGIESALSPMARLGAMQNRPQYILWARDIAHNIQHDVARPQDEPTAHRESTALHTHEERPFFHHAYSYLNTTCGMVDLALATDDPQYIQQAKTIFEKSRASVWIDGDFPESCGDYYERCDETCAAVEWMMLALELYSVSGEARYLDWAELTLMNQLLCGMDSDGNFTTYRSVNRRHWMDKNNHGGPQTDCCSMSGPWGLAQAALYAVTFSSPGQGRVGASVNLPVDVEVRREVDGKTVGITQRIAVNPYDLAQSIQVRNDSAKKLAIKVRAPYWCPWPTVKVNGKSARATARQGFLHFTCPAGGTLAVELTLSMRLVVVPARRNALNMADAEDTPGDATEKGLNYGPFAFMFEREMYPKITLKDLKVSVPVDGQGRPMVNQEPPQGWDERRGVVNLFVEAKLADGTAVQLTPCGNLTLTPFKVADPYVLRFADMELRTTGKE